MRRLRIAGALALITIACVASLTGCDPIYQKSSPVAVRLHDGNLQVRVCSALEVDRIFAQTRTPGVGDWTTFFDAKGSLTLAEGQTISSATPPDGIAHSTWITPALAGGDEITMTLKAADGDSAHGVFVNVHIPSSGMPTARWLRADSSVTSSAC